MVGQRGRFAWRDHVRTLDPEADHEEITRGLAQREFPWDVQQALSFALFRTYAVPSIGSLLARTDEFTARTQKRHDDTALVLDAVLRDGPDSPDGRSAVRRMNRMHGSYDIGNEDMVYVLSTFVVMPIRWIRRYGWRDPLPVEVEASVRYYQRLGRLMGIRDVPADYAGFERLLEDQEARRFAFDEGARAVADATLDLFATFYPAPLRPAMRVFAVALMDDHLRRAFGYADPPAYVVRLAHASLIARGRLVRLLPPRRTPYDLRRNHRIRSYPGGHLVTELGTFPDHRDRAGEGSPTPG